MLRFFLVLVAVADCSPGVISACIAADVDSAPVLSALSAVDETYFKKLTLAGRERVGVGFLRLADPGGVFKWRFTRRDDVICLHRQLVTPNAIQFLPKGESTALDHDERGNLIANVLVDEKLHFSPQERFRLQRYDRCIVSPAGDVLDRQPCDVVEFFGASDPDPALPIHRAMWSVGRGFSRHLEQVLESKMLPEGEVFLRASGFTAPATHGVWELVIDPSRSYLVVKADFTREGRETATISIKNTLSTGENSCEVAGSASWSIDFGKPKTDGIGCERAGFIVDEDLLALCETAKSGPFSPGSIAFDNRSGRPEPLKIRRPVPAAAAGPVATSQFPLFLILLNVHLILGVVGIVLWNRRRRTFVK